MFEHSVKVPRNFKTAANILKKVSVEGGSVKTLLYDSKLRHFNTNVLYALIIETIKHAADLDKMFESCNLLANEPRLDPWLAKILTTELLFGKKELPGHSKPEKTILSYKEQFEKYANEHEGDLKTEVKVRRPRYVRINTNLLTTSDAIRAFQDEGYKFVRCTSGSYDDYLKQIQNLSEYDFTQDYHVKTVFVFSAGTKLHENDLYFENKIILQDKATAMAVYLLAPPPGSVILDMCAAPGMKTTQVAAHIRNQGKVYAVERNEKRYQTLCDFVQKTESKCVETHNKDALDIKRGDFDDVEYILLDPSCSGSGMELSVHNYIDSTRLAKLTSLQEKFLKHAMNAFPKAKRIVYSTCSLYPEENERVVTNVVKTSRAKWRVQEVKELLKGQWNNFGSAMYGTMGTRCLYAKPDTDLTTGFFLAVLDRDAKDLEKGQGDGELNEVKIGNDDTKTSSKRKKRNAADVDEEYSNKEKSNEEINSDECTIYETVSEVNNEGIKMKKKKSKHKDCTSEDINNISANIEDELAINEIENTSSTFSRKKKKRKNKHIDSDNINNSCDINKDESINAEVQNTTAEGTKKNKKNKHKDIEQKEIENTSNNDELLYTEEIKTESNEKKKKKSKLKEYLNDAVVNDSPNDEFIEVNKEKKKNKKRIDNQEVMNETETIDNTKGTKNKGKRKLSSDMTEDVTNSYRAEVESNEVPKAIKKHKKK